MIRIGVEFYAEEFAVEVMRSTTEKENGDKRTHARNGTILSVSIDIQITTMSQVQSIKMQV